MTTLSPEQLREIEGRAVTLIHVDLAQGGGFRRDPGCYRIDREQWVSDTGVEGRWLPLADHALLCSALRAAWAEIARLGGEG